MGRLFQVENDKARRTRFVDPDVPYSDLDMIEVCRLCGTPVAYEVGNNIAERTQIMNCDCWQRIDIDLRSREPRKPQRKGFPGIVKTACELCGFVALDPCQLDVHHINGDKRDNSNDNAQVLCANCHRLVTKANKQGIYNEEIIATRLEKRWNPEDDALI